MLHVDMDVEGSVVRVWHSGESSWVEFRGSPYSEWSEDERNPAQDLHDCLTGPHASVLHAGDELVVLPWHEDYSDVEMFYQTG